MGGEVETWEVKGRGSGVKDNPLLYCEFDIPGLQYIVSQKNKNKDKNKKIKKKERKKEQWLKKLALLLRALVALLKDPGSIPSTHDHLTLVSPRESNTLF